MVSPFTQPDYTSQSGTVYPISIDDAIAVLARVGAAFAPHESDPPDMKVRLRAGFIMRRDQLPLAVAAQETDALTAPSADPRHDVVYVDRATGAIGVATGAEAAEPEDPAVPVGKTPVARVRLAPAQTEIVNADLDDLRDWAWGLGQAAFEDLGAAAAEIALNAEAFVDVASAATTDIGAAASHNLRITGTTTIAALGTVAAGLRRRLRFADELTLTHDGTSLILPGEADITTAADDTAEFISLGDGNWLCLSYKRASGEPVAGATSDFLLYQNQQSSGTAGPSFSSGAWRTVPLNTEVADAGDHGALAGNQVTLAAGTYDYQAHLAARQGASSPNIRMRLRLRNITDSETVHQGPNANTLNGASAVVIVGGRFTIADAKAFEVQVYPNGATAQENAVTSGDAEIYGHFELRKIG